MILSSKTINLRLIEETDAEFVLQLRQDDRYNKYLSMVSSSVAAQREWICNYKNDENNGKQYYFIIETKDKRPCGTIRVYDFREDSFSWGSWILNENKTRYSALESALLIYDFGFKELAFMKSHFEVMKGNSKVIAFHEKMGAGRVDEDSHNIYFEITRKAVESFRENYMSLLST
jgi:RimJ/RimL family protein N-acetyltransferase